MKETFRNIEEVEILTWRLNGLQQALVQTLSQST